MIYFLSYQNASIQFPDNSIQITASNTYTISYTTAQTITIPSNCYKIDIFAVGAGGNSGAYNNGYGSSGGGGGFARTTLLVQPSMIFTLSFVAGSGGYVQLDFNKTGVTSPFCRAYNGNNGNNGSSNFTSQGASSSTASVVFTASPSYYTWITGLGTGSANRPPGANAPSSTAGAPACFNYVAGEYGCGQLFQGIYLGATSVAGSAVCMFTYYVNN